MVTISDPMPKVGKLTKSTFLDLLKIAYPNTSMNQCKCIKALEGMFNALELLIKWGPLNPRAKTRSKAKATYSRVY